MIFHASRSVGIICECGAIIQGKCTPEESQLSCDPMESIANIFSILNNNSNIFTVWIEFDAVPVSVQFLNVAQLLHFHDKDTTRIEQIWRRLNGIELPIAIIATCCVIVARRCCWVYHQSSLARSLASLEKANIGSGSSCFFGSSESTLAEICNSHVRSSTAH